MTSPNPVLPVLPASSMTSTDFADQAIGALLGSAGEQAANFLGGLLINSLLQGLGFSSQSQELSEILSLEQQILYEMTQFSSEIELQTVNIEAFTGAVAIINAFEIMEGFTSQTEPSVVRNFVNQYMSDTSGMALSLTGYQEAVMQGVGSSVDPPKPLFTIMASTILDQYWGKVSLVDILSFSKGILNQVVALQVKGLAVLYNVTYADARGNGKQSPEVAAATAQQALQRFVSGTADYACDLQHQQAAWQAAVPDWLLAPPADGTGFYISNKQFPSLNLSIGTLFNSYGQVYNVCVSPDQNVNSNMTLYFPDPTKPIVQIFRGVAPGVALSLQGDTGDDLCFFGQMVNSSFNDTWTLIPFLDDNGILATAVVTGIGHLIGGDVYMLSVNTSKQTFELSLTSDYSSENHLWHFQTIPA